MSAYPDFATHPGSFGGVPVGMPLAAAAPAAATKPATAKP
jgi:hypothetical protein